MVKKRDCDILPIKKFAQIAAGYSQKKEGYAILKTSCELLDRTKMLRFPLHPLFGN